MPQGRKIWLWPDFNCHSFGLVCVPFQEQVCFLIGYATFTFLIQVVELYPISMQLNYLLTATWWIVCVSTAEYTGESDEYLQWGRRLWQRGGERGHCVLYQLRWHHPEPGRPRQGVSLAGPRGRQTPALKPVSVPSGLGSNSCLSRKWWVHLNNVSSPSYPHIWKHWVDESHGGCRSGIFFQQSCFTLFRCIPSCHCQQW